RYPQAFAHFSLNPPRGRIGLRATHWRCLERYALPLPFTSFFFPFQRPWRRGIGAGNARRDEAVAARSPSPVKVTSRPFAQPDRAPRTIAAGTRFPRIETAAAIFRAVPGTASG